MGQVIEAKKNPTKQNQMKTEDHVNMLTGDGTLGSWLGSMPRMSHSRPAIPTPVMT